MRLSHYVIQLNEQEEGAFLKSRLSDRKEKGILILSDEIGLEQYKRMTAPFKIRQFYLTGGADIYRESRKIRKGYHLIGSAPSGIIDHIRRSQIDMSFCRTVIARLPSGKEESFLGDVSFIISHMPGLRNLFIIGDRSKCPADNPLLNSAETSIKPYIVKKERDVAKIPENMISAMDELVSKTRSDKEPDKLSEYRKIFKKCVPFGFRGWVVAFLLREYLSRNKSFKLPQLKEGVTLFVSIGKNRKVYPKDLIHLFINTGKVERDHIGEIRILDNYAFISIEKKAAETAIDNLNGINYRGRTLTVNFAKQK